MTSKAEEAAHEATHQGTQNKKIALFISVLALFLAVSETLGKSAQTAALSDNVEASNLWAFFQAKTIRRTLVETAAQEMAIQAIAVTQEETKTAMAKQIDAWQKTGQRYRSEPRKGPHGEELGEGSEELSKRAIKAQSKRDLALAQYHHFEVSSAAFQIAIVLASASIIASLNALVWVSAASGFGGLVIAGLGQFAPLAFNLFGGH